MRRYRLHRALRAANLSLVEELSLLSGIFLAIAAVVVALGGWDAGGPARAIGSAGLAALVLCAASRAVRTYRAGIEASLPAAVAKARVRARPASRVGASAVAVMEICSAPSRVLLAFSAVFAPPLARWTIRVADFGQLAAPAMVPAVAALCLVPPAFAVGWVSRLSVLGMSRAREFSADAGAVALTRRPSALASALLKLERRRDWAPREDLRRVEAYAVLCIVGGRASGLGRLFATHPPTPARVKRLEEIESRIR